MRTKKHGSLDLSSIRRCIYFKLKCDFEVYNKVSNLKKNKNEERKMENKKREGDR